MSDVKSKYFVKADEILDNGNLRSLLEQYLEKQQTLIQSEGRDDYIRRWQFSPHPLQDELVSPQFLDQLTEHHGDIYTDTWQYAPSSKVSMTPVNETTKRKRMLPLPHFEDTRTIVAGITGQLIKELPRLRWLAGDSVDSLPQTNTPKPFHTSGRFLYPPGGCMGWHTNHDIPGHRIYISYAEEPNQSFLRYRDPETGEIKTDWDSGWNIRMFETGYRELFWHCVSSNTFRYSLGFRAEFPAISWDSTSYNATRGNATLPEHSAP